MIAPPLLRNRTRTRLRTLDRGFTMVELMLSLSITAVIALTLAMMLSGLGASGKHEQQIRRAMMQRQVAVARTGMVLRSPRMILARGADHLVLWQHDGNGNELPERSELVRLQWDADAQELRVYQVPGDFDTDLDVTYALADNFSVITANLVADETLEERVILRNMTSFASALDHADVREARLVRLRFDLNVDGTTESVTITSLLRVPG